MSTSKDALSPFGTLLHAGDALGLTLVRILSVQSGNRYSAQAVEFDDDATQLIDGATLTVTNLAEPADETGQLPADTEAVAVDVEGRWIVFVRLDSGGEGGSSVGFPARIVSAQGGAVYTVREQAISPEGTFSDAAGTSNQTARNLAELSLGPGAAVPDDTIVWVAGLEDTGTPPTVRYVFDHPAYAKYLS